MAEFSEQLNEPVPEPAEVEPAGGLAPQPEVEPVVKLSQPSKEQATRFLRKVSFLERLVGVSTHPGPGDQDMDLYNLEEAAGFLDGGNLTGQDFVNSVPFDTLKKWVGETLGDKELALAIGEIVKEADKPMTFYQLDLKRLELIEPVKELMLQRLKQCKELLGIVWEEPGT